MKSEQTWGFSKVCSPLELGDAVGTGEKANKAWDFRRLVRRLGLEWRSRRQEKRTGHANFEDLFAAWGWNGGRDGKKSEQAMRIMKICSPIGQGMADKRNITNNKRKKQLTSARK